MISPMILARVSTQLVIAMDQPITAIVGINTGKDPTETTRKDEDEKRLTKNRSQEANPKG